MADLIDRQKAIEQAVNESQSEGAYGYMDTKSIVDMLEDLPKVDAVEVVRCKDCRKRKTCRTPTVWAVAPGDDWFCADGERRTDE